MKSKTDQWHFDTLAVHAGQAPDPTTGAIMPAIYQTSTYVQPEVGVHKGYEYSRTGNPTRTVLEANLAALEGARFGLAFASGCAAASSVLHLLESGDHVVAMDDLYGGTYRLFDNVFVKQGLEFSYVDMTDPGRVAEAVRSETRLIWIETPTNPLLKLVDIEAVARIGHQVGAWVVVDNTFMTPCLQRPLELGADLVLHSTTKYLNGHSDVIGGCVMTNDADLHERLAYLQNAMGAVPGPMDAWLVLRGIKTLPLRMARHVENARRVAEFLEGHDRVARVIYPGLQSHPQFALGMRQMRAPGGMVSVELDADLDAARRFAAGTRVFSLAESLGGVESLIEIPAAMTHAAMPPELRKRIGVTDGLIRLSVGVEHAGDLIEDLEHAFSCL